MHLLRKALTYELVRRNSPRLFHTTSVTSVDVRWRRENKLPDKVRREEELFDRPDYSFRDGRPTPISDEIREKYEDEKRLCQDAIRLLGELKYAVDRQEQRKLDAEQEARDILSRKLQPKGPMYKPKNSEK